MKKSLTVILVVALALGLAAPAMAQPKGGALMEEDAFTPIALGYDMMRDGKFEGAEHEFQKALKADRYNPFALNNLATLEERKGKLKDAMAFLTDAGTYADQYFDKVQETCFVGGLCAGVKPARQAGAESGIAKVIKDNMAKLKAKIEATPAKPEPSKPPKM